jgi:polysaccharide biosynthesis protein PslH
MRILWAKADFLHPTTKGGQIRTLQTLRHLHRRHEVHYVGLEDTEQPEGVERSNEYCSYVYPVPHRAADKRSPAFLAQLLQGLYSELPVAVLRYRSANMRAVIERLTGKHRFDAIVCDFLAPAPNMPNLSRCVLFQHNVETMIWRRHAEHAPDPLRGAYFRLQANRMFEYERRVCRAVRSVIAVSEEDARLMRQMFGLEKVPAVPTGVDVEFFTPPGENETAHKADLVFLGSMDWLPNIDGVLWFTAEVLPLIRQRRPECRVAIVGRKPSPEIQALAEADPMLVVTGTVPDVRPYLWGSTVSVVPLRIGGGTRLKIYEAMAARVPVVSTTIGAEGLEIHPGRDIRIADDATAFAQACLELLEDAGRRQQQEEAAWQLVASRFSWGEVTRQFEEVLEEARVAAG